MTCRHCEKCDFNLCGTFFIFTHSFYIPYINIIACKTCKNKLQVMWEEGENTVFGILSYKIFSQGQVNDNLLVAMSHFLFTAV